MQSEINYNAISHTELELVLQTELTVPQHKTRFRQVKI